MKAVYNLNILAEMSSFSPEEKPCWNFLGLTDLENVMLMLEYHLRFSGICNAKKFKQLAVSAIINNEFLLWH